MIFHDILRCNVLWLVRYGLVLCTLDINILYIHNISGSYSYYYYSHVQITQYNHSIQSLNTITQYNHSIQSLNTITQYNHSIQSLTSHNLNNTSDHSVLHHINPLPATQDFPFLFSPQNTRKRDISSFHDSPQLIRLTVPTE